MKKVGLLIIACAVLLSGCGKENIKDETDIVSENDADNCNNDDNKENVVTQNEIDEKEINEFEQKIQVNYNGFEFGLGDKMSEIVLKLGDEASTSQTINDKNVNNAEVIQYYYYGMTINVKNDVIYSIDIADNGYENESVISTAAGMELNMQEEEIVKLYGRYNITAGGNYYYQKGDMKMRVRVEEKKIVEILLLNSGM